MVRWRETAFLETWSYPKRDEVLTVRTISVNGKAEECLAVESSQDCVRT